MRREGTYTATSHSHTTSAAGVPAGDLGEGLCPSLSLNISVRLENGSVEEGPRFGNS